jgi:hypothetical protein
MPTIDLSQPIHNEDDSVTTEKDKAGKDAPVTLRTALRRALLSDTDEIGGRISGDAKVERYDLFLKLKNGADAAELTPEEVVLLRKVVLVFPTLVAGQLRAMLNEPAPK